MKYRVRPVIVEAMRWTKHTEHPKVRSPAGAAPGRYVYGVIDTPHGPKPIEDGDWIVTDANGATVPWRHEHFTQVFEQAVSSAPVTASPTVDPFS